MVESLWGDIRHCFNYVVMRHESKDRVVIQSYCGERCQGLIDSANMNPEVILPILKRASMRKRSPQVVNLQHKRKYPESTQKRVDVGTKLRLQGTSMVCRDGHGKGDYGKD